MRKALLVMAKRPFPGKTKTRLTPYLSEEAAAALYACFLGDVFDLVRGLPGVTPFVAYAPAEAETAAFFHNLAPDFQLIAQKGETLGARLDTVLSRCLADGYGQVVAMNSDSPTLPAAYLMRGFGLLDDPAVDVVLGPCEDGGYYLIGWKRPYPRLVRSVQMSTPHVLRDTLTIAAADNLRVSLLPSWYDVDEIPELHRLQEALLSGREHAAQTQRFFENGRQ